MPALSRTQEQLNFSPTMIAAATILATKGFGEITLWPGFGVWRWSTATSPSNPHRAGTTILAQIPPGNARAGGEIPLMKSAKTKP
jgi:hypothetical protein